MEVLLPELERTSVDTVMFEARQIRNNRHDLDMVDACRRKKLISQGLHVSFGAGQDEPLLWLADVTCGAVLGSQRGESSYLQQFGSSARVLTIDVP